MSFNGMPKHGIDNTGLKLKREYVGTEVFSKKLNTNIRVEDSYWKFDYYISAGLQFMFE